MISSSSEEFSWFNSSAIVTVPTLPQPPSGLPGHRVLELSQSGERPIGSVSIPLLLRRLERDDGLFPVFKFFT